MPESILMNFTQPGEEHGVEAYLSLDEALLSRIEEMQPRAGVGYTRAAVAVLDGEKAIRVCFAKDPDAPALKDITCRVSQHVIWFEGWDYDGGAIYYTTEPIGIAWIRQVVDQPHSSCGPNGYRLRTRLPLAASNVLMPTRHEARLARQAARSLSVHTNPPKNLTVQVMDKDRPQVEVEIPAPALRLLVKALSHLGQGHALALESLRPEISTGEAADLLAVSRAYLSRLLDEGEIPFHKTGRHRRVLLRDVLAYRERNEAARQLALDALTELDQAQNMGY